MFISLLILKQMDVNQNLPNRERKMQSACLFLLWGGGMNNYWLIQCRIKNYSISHKVLVYTVCNLLCHNLSNRKSQYPPNSCFYWRESSKTSINLRMNLIFSHISLTNNWFAPRITELVLKSGRHEKAIRLCLVPYFRSPNAYWFHTFLPSSVRYWLSILLLIQF